MQVQYVIGAGEMEQLKSYLDLLEDALHDGDLKKQLHLLDCVRKVTGTHWNDE